MDSWLAVTHIGREGAGGGDDLASQPVPVPPPRPGPPLNTELLTH